MTTFRTATTGCPGWDGDRPGQVMGSWGHGHGLPAGATQAL